MDNPVVTYEHLVGAHSFRQVVDAAATCLPGNLHLWQFDLDRHADLGLGGGSYAELRRASCIAAEFDRRRFLTSRALLREVLGAYSGIPSRQIEFLTADRRKPVVSGSTLSFNLSHSQTRLAIAIGSSGLLGVDIEHVRRTQDLVLARSTFDPSEVRFLESLSDRERQLEFFRHWVCREAVLKAVGVGFQGKGLALRRNSLGKYHVRVKPSGWGDIALAEFADENVLRGAICWSPPVAVQCIHHFLVN